MQTLGPDHWPRDAARVVDYYRVDQRRHLLQTWLRSLCLLYLGCALAVVASLERSTPNESAPLLGVMGFAVIALGLFCTFQGLAQGLCSERYVSLRRDGLVVRLDGAPVLIDWDELEEARHQADERSVLLVLRNGQELRLTDRYMDVEADRLARQIATVHRRALWGYYERSLNSR